jgi:hypothetical protein
VGKGSAHLTFFLEIFFFIVTVVPLPTFDLTLTVSMKHSIMEKPMPERSSRPS